MIKANGGLLNPEDLRNAAFNRNLRPEQVDTRDLREARALLEELS